MKYGVTYDDTFLQLHPIDNLLPNWVNMYASQTVTLKNIKYLA